MIPPAALLIVRRGMGHVRELCGLEAKSSSTPESIGGLVV